MIQEKGVWRVRLGMSGGLGRRLLYLADAARGLVEGIRNGISDLSHHPQDGYALEDLETRTEGS